MPNAISSPLAKRAGIFTFSALALLSEQELLDIKGITTDMISTIRRELALRGRTLKGDRPTLDPNKIYLCDDIVALLSARMITTYPELVHWSYADLLAIGLTPLMIEKVSHQMTIRGLTLKDEEKPNTVPASGSAQDTAVKEIKAAASALAAPETPPNGGWHGGLVADPSQPGFFPDRVDLDRIKALGPDESYDGRSNLPGKLPVHVVEALRDNGITSYSQLAKYDPWTLVGMKGIDAPMVHLMRHELVLRNLNFPPEVTDPSHQGGLITAIGPDDLCHADFPFVPGKLPLEVVKRLNGSGIRWYNDLTQCLLKDLKSLGLTQTMIDLIKWVLGEKRLSLRAEPVSDAIQDMANELNRRPTVGDKAEAVGAAKYGDTIEAPSGKEGDPCRAIPAGTLPSSIVGHLAEIGITKYSGLAAFSHAQVAQAGFGPLAMAFIRDALAVRGLKLRESGAFTQQEMSKENERLGVLWLLEGSRLPENAIQSLTRAGFRTYKEVSNLTYSELFSIQGLNSDVIPDIIRELGWRNMNLRVPYQPVHTTENAEPAPGPTAQPPGWNADVPVNVAPAMTPQQTACLRDRFAMAALTGLLANGHTDVNPVIPSVRPARGLSSLAYRFADAMLWAKEHGKLPDREVPE